jgi:hypothetical protein
MKKILFLIMITISLGFLSTSCTKDFAELNKNPNLVNNPDLSMLYTSALYTLGQYQYTEWFYDNYQYHMRYTEQVVSGGGNGADFNQIGATGGRYGSFYVGIYNTLDEIRRRIDVMPSTTKANYDKFRAMTYIIQIMQGIKVTDMYGSIPYIEAEMGRYDGKYTPKYDSQEELFNTWNKQLNDAITVLIATKANQVSPSKQDFVYKGDYTKWAKLANSLKLRIAARLEKANIATAKTIINEALASPAGLITETSDQMVWEPATDYRGEAQDFWGSPSGAKNFVNFLRKNQDPRLRFFFERNKFDQTAVSLLISQGKTLPKFVKNPVVEPWDRYQGAPSSPDSASIYDYFKAYKDNAGTTYSQLSFINRKLFNPQYNGNTGHWSEVYFGAAETCLYLAEFTEKGYVTGKGTAQSWYEKGVKASLSSYNTMASVAMIDDYATLQLATGEDVTLLTKPDVAYGTNNLEKIYLQEYVNFFRLPNECNTLVRRTGYPKKGSSILPWETVTSSGVEMVFPRRFPISIPGVTLNLTNFNAAITAQGFSIGKNDGPTLNTERVWWDKSCPNYGTGN